MQYRNDNRPQGGQGGRPGGQGGYVPQSQGQRGGAPGNRQQPRRQAAPHQGTQQPSRRPAAAGGGQSKGRRGKKQKPPKTKIGASRWARAIIMVMATIGLCIFLAFFILSGAMDIFGLNQINQQIEVEIPEGSTTKDIAEILAEAGVVNQPGTFRFYAGLKTEDADFQPGNYIMNSNMGYDEIIVALKSSASIKEEVNVKFIEGWTLNEFAAELEAKEVCGAQEFKDYLETAEFTSEFINAIPNSDLRYYRLEGYLFPDTYTFYKGEDVGAVARKILNNFNDKITSELRTRMSDLNLTLDEAVTLASIIQREAGNPMDMKQVSSAFHNRLNNPEAYPSLQSDVTVLYVNDNIKPYLEQTNQAMYDAYNTYVCEGLPVGAICNPGLDAIEAVLYPDNTDYYFFVTDSEGSFYYAVTEQEHFNNVYKASLVGTGETYGIDTM